MPEGPEIRRAADRLAEAIVGDALTLAWFAFPKLASFEKKLVGATVISMLPRGKALLTAFDNGWTLYSHNQLYGVWKIGAPGDRPESSRSLRVALETHRRAVLLYSASDVSMWRSDEVHQHPFLSKLGPDVLDAALDADAVAARLIEPRFAKRSLGALLLDQSFLAGMGNYLRSEVLFAAKVLPERRPRDLSTSERRALARELLAIPRASYATRGIEPADGMREDYLTDTPRGFRFAVFNRDGQACARCAATIERQETGSRRLYLCRGCQQ